MYLNLSIKNNLKKITSDFLNLKIYNFQQAIDFVKNLPYARNSKRDNYELVLSEKRGTCSTKHALLAKLSEEQNFQFDLYLCIFEMSTENTPKIKKILQQNNLFFIPEAHCYLYSKINDQIIDITFPENTSNNLNILYKEKINPEDIGQYKIKMHKDYLMKFITSEKLDISFEKLWEIREKCIKELSR